MRRSLQRDLGVHELTQRGVEIVSGDLDAVAGLDQTQGQIARGRGRQLLARQLEQDLREVLAQQGTAVLPAAMMRPRSMIAISSQSSSASSM